MIRWLFVVFLLAVAGGAAVVWFLTIPVTVAASALGGHAIDLNNGKRIFYAGGCASCHATPGQPDRTQLGGGLPLRSPFGTFHVPNVSPHPTDGIGGWTEAQFVTAMIKGTSPDGSHYYPSFPYPSYRLMNIPDLRDLYAFVKTLPSVEGRARAHELSFPFNVRRLVGIWKVLFFSQDPFVPVPAQSEQWNRGAYLVTGPGHCGECHTSRNFLGATRRDMAFAGGPNPEGAGWIPNITQHGLKSWTVEDIADFLQYGDKPDGRPIVGSMVPVVRNLSQLPAEDREAMAVYLKSLPPIEGPRRPARN